MIIFAAMGTHGPVAVEWWQEGSFLGSALALLIMGGALALRWRMGRWERARKSREAFAQRLIESQENERRRISAELHDGLGQSLLIVKNRAQMAAKIPGLPHEAEEQLKEISASAQEAIDEVRGIVQDLRPIHLDRLGLSRALNGMLNQLSESGAVKLRWNIDRVDGAIPREREIDLYRVVQEAMNNVVKHSSAALARVELRREASGLILEIEDDGKGFDSRDNAANGRDSALGLNGIRERIRMLGGTVDLRSAPGEGTKLKAEIPFR